MTTKERLHQIIDTWDDTRVEALLVVLEPGDASSNEASNGHNESTDRMALLDAEWQTLTREAQATPPDERTPFQDGLVAQAAKEAELIKTPQGRAQLERDRLDRERLHNAPPITADDPLWDMIGVLSGGPDSPGDVAENHDKYLAEAYADTHET